MESIESILIELSLKVYNAGMEGLDQHMAIVLVDLVDRDALFDDRL